MEQALSGNLTDSASMCSHEFLTMLLQFEINQNWQTTVHCDHRLACKKQNIVHKTMIPIGNVILLALKFKYFLKIRHELNGQHIYKVKC